MMVVLVQRVQHFVWAFTPGACFSRSETDQVHGSTGPHCLAGACLNIQRGVKGLMLHLQTSALGHFLESLADTQISQHIFSTSKHSIEWNCAMVVLNEATHSTLRDTAPTEDLHSISRGLLSGDGRVAFEQGNGTGERRMSESWCD